LRKAGFKKRTGQQGRLTITTDREGRSIGVESSQIKKVAIVVSGAFPRSKIN